MNILLDEFATLLNALRYYTEHNEPHEQETLLIAKLEQIAEFDRNLKSGKWYDESLNPTKAQEAEVCAWWSLVKPESPE